MDAGDRVVVIGAGVSGLTTAVVLAEAGMGARVHVVAEEIPGVTSLAAGAMWGPYLVEPRQKVDQWSQHSLSVFRELTDDPASGVRLVSGIEASRHAKEPPDWARTLPGFRHADPGALPDGFTSGYRFTVPLIDMPVYLGYLQRRLVAAGATIERRRLTTITEAGPATVIVNCTGLGAGLLVPDPQLRAIGGQHVVVANPGLAEFFSEDTGLSSELLCIYPHGDTVVLGGTAVDGDASLSVDERAAEAILVRCTKVEPRLADSPVLEHRVGARPTRDQVRVEAEPLPGGALLVHNYGHGGAGVTLSWGCAAEVHELCGQGHRG